MASERGLRDAKLGDTLVYLGIIDETQLREALKRCDPEQRRLGETLVSLGFTTEEKILKGVASRLGIA